MGFFAKGLDGRIDDPNAGWKGRGLWTSSGDRTPWLQEGGKGMRLMAVQSRSIPIRSPSNGSPDRDGLRPQTARLIWCITARSAAGGFRFHCPPTHQQ
jgi:hypothetical protein